MQARIDNLLSRISFKGLAIVPHFEMDLEGAMRSARWYIRVECPAGSPWGFDTVTGAPHSWMGRKWRLAPHMTDGEIVQTALMAILAALEHEARELFKFDGVSVFDPHYDIHKLVELRKAAGAIAERPL